MQKINGFLKGEAATVTVLLFALAAQIPHASGVFANILRFYANHTSGEWITGWLFAIAMESAVLLFVVQGRKKVSYVFALISILMNLSYYHMHGVGIFSWGAFPIWLVSFTLPLAIAVYSHGVAGHTATVSVESPVAKKRDSRGFQAPMVVIEPEPVKSPEKRPSEVKREPGHPGWASEIPAGLTPGEIINFWVSIGSPGPQKSLSPLTGWSESKVSRYVKNLNGVSGG